MLGVLKEPVFCYMTDLLPAKMICGRAAVLCLITTMFLSCNLALYGCLNRAK
jgi:hypothetical protein